MKIVLSKYIGPCFGVVGAIDEVFSKKEKIKIFGEIAHNEHIVNKISKMKNVTIVNNSDEVNEKETVIIRTHGIPIDDFIKLKNKKAKIIDKTCPNVKFVHKISEKCSLEKNFLIIVGDSKHPEVVGIKSRCKNSVVINRLDDVNRLTFNKNLKNIVVSQTTFNYEKFNEICNLLTKKINNIKCYNTICKDAINRRDEIFKNSNKFDIILVVGSKKSSNSVKLFNFAKCFNNKVEMISNITDIDSNMFKNVNSVFITSGSSVMKETINEVVETIKNIIC